MSDGRRPVLLQICPNDHPPFGDICRSYAVAAGLLSWRTETIILEPRSPTREPTFHYPASGMIESLRRLLDGGEPVLTLCHRHRAYRAAVESGVIHSPVVAVAHEFGFFRRRRRRWQRHWDRLRRRPPVIFAGVSDAVRRELALAVGDVVLLPNGIDLAHADTMRLSREASLAALGLSNGPFNIGVVGRLHPKKNPGLAVAGFAAVAAEMPAARLVLVGKGALDHELRQQAGELPVTFAGFVPEASRLMAAFDLLLIPSGEREAFGMVALEAMAAGVPVLCGPSPGPRFVVGDCGRFFDRPTAGDVSGALLAAYRDWRDGLLQELAQRGRARVEREFSVAACASRLQALALAQ